MCIRDRNEFEPAAGIKVSKIINLADDIARNTSSESARISTIPGSNTIGIELPNLSRENVYLSEILNSPDFNKKEIKLPIALVTSSSTESFKIKSSVNTWLNLSVCDDSHFHQGLSVCQKAFLPLQMPLS